MMVRKTNTWTHRTYIETWCLLYLLKKTLQSGLNLKLLQLTAGGGRGPAGVSGGTAEAVPAATAGQQQGGCDAAAAIRK